MKLLETVRLYFCLFVFLIDVCELNSLLFLHWEILINFLVKTRFCVPEPEVFLPTSCLLLGTISREHNLLKLLKKLTYENT